MMLQVADDGKLNVSDRIIRLVKELGNRESSQVFNNLQEIMFMSKECKKLCARKVVVVRLIAK